jgi:DNA end-binding protein Ku
VKLAGDIIDTKAGKFDPSEFVDHYEVAVVEMLKKKQAGVPVSKEAPAARTGKVINLMDALRKSAQSTERRSLPKRAAAATKTPAKRSSARTRKAG